MKNYIAIATFDGREGMLYPGMAIKDESYGAELYRLGLARLATDDDVQKSEVAPVKKKVTK